MEENYKYRIPDQVSTRFEMFGLKYWYEYLAAVLILLFNGLLFFVVPSVPALLVTWIVTLGIPFSMLLVESNGQKLYEDLWDIISYQLKKKRNEHFHDVQVKGDEYFVVYSKDIEGE
ncbi:hypothetical protein ABHN11_24380 [Brevibacillus centrosporus]|uniref:hypothetical protein n=1 Tax=Brevibacillus centrosporus TaxID=54910 RepID=UPI003D1EFA07